MAPKLATVLPWLAAGAAAALALRAARGRAAERGVRAQEAGDLAAAEGELYVRARDMAERMHTEEALRQSEARLRTLVDRAAYGIYTASADGRFLSANPALASMLGYGSADELCGLDIARDVYANSTDRDRVIARALAGTLPDWVDVEWRRRDGTPITVRMSARAQRDQDGQLRFCEAIVENVTERRRHDDVLRRGERLASLGRMLAGAAHELNNPLAAVCGFAQLLLRSPLAEDNRVALETIDHEASRAAAIVRDLLTFSRRRESNERRRVDLNAVASYIAQTRRYALAATGIGLELDLCHGALDVLGDAPQLEQVVLNLVANAEQALEPVAETRRAPGGDARAPDPGAPAIIVRTARRGEVATLEVIDNGPGIADAALPLIWDPFWTTKGDNEGTGLGLSVAHGIVTDHGGAIDVQGVAGDGACFRIAFPLLAEQELREAPVSPHRAPRPLDILVVDGEPATAEFLTRFFSARGHAVLTVPDGEQALRLAARSGFDVIVADLLLPGIAGADLISRLRALPTCAEARYIGAAAGGHGLDGAAAGVAGVAGVTTVLPKPYEIEQLRQAVERD